MRSSDNLSWPIARHALRGKSRSVSSQVPLQHASPPDSGSLQRANSTRRISQQTVAGMIFCGVAARKAWMFHFCWRVSWLCPCSTSIRLMPWTIQVQMSNSVSCKKHSPLRPPQLDVKGYALSKLHKSEFLLHLSVSLFRWQYTNFKIDVIGGA
jgi:hypothetical protein